MTGEWGVSVEDLAEDVTLVRDQPCPDHWPPPAERFELRYTWQTTAPARDFPKRTFDRRFASLDKAITSALCEWRRAQPRGLRILAVDVRGLPDGEWKPVDLRGDAP